MIMERSKHPQLKVIKGFFRSDVHVGLNLPASILGEHSGVWVSIVALQDKSPGFKSTSLLGLSALPRYSSF